MDGLKRIRSSKRERFLEDLNLTRLTFVCVFESPLERILSSTEQSKRSKPQKAERVKETHYTLTYAGYTFPVPSAEDFQHPIASTHLARENHKNAHQPTPPPPSPLLFQTPQSLSLVRVPIGDLPSPSSGKKCAVPRVPSSRHVRHGRSNGHGKRTAGESWRGEVPEI